MIRISPGNSEVAVAGQDRQMRLKVQSGAIVEGISVSFAGLDAVAIANDCLISSR